ncbi:MAG: hypothetical protein I3270_00815 [Candidatus Moeniiplasma glomeromycotorum]|nr:hypothetical protein [Candidatus Moeniiplasma glomeromycotorum]MCE8162166.1 hypothetical protein [Candidatus Moeniiplasma glomeromycotorum]MCE8166179.1 hypothetical protein [Candidatus Moeniiplasma glomeromycotorum]MCE8166565.1 hypothetical protein [Candidatus Moeniiplasma glomeromycotorum]
MKGEVKCRIEVHRGHCFNCYSPRKKDGVRICKADWVICYRLPITAELKINNENVLASSNSLEDIKKRSGIN